MPDRVKWEPLSVLAFVKVWRRLAASGRIGEFKGLDYWLVRGAWAAAKYPTPIEAFIIAHAKGAT